METPQSEALREIALAAWKCDHASGCIEGLGHVEIERIGKTRKAKLDGKAITMRMLFRAVFTEPTIKRPLTTKLETDMDLSELNYEQLLAEYNYGRNYTPGFREAFRKEIAARDRAYCQHAVEQGLGGPDT